MASVLCLLLLVVPAAAEWSAASRLKNSLNLQQLSLLLRPLQLNCPDHSRTFGAAIIVARTSAIDLSPSWQLILRVDQIRRRIQKEFPPG